MSASWTRTRRIGFDTETTGVDCTTARIVTAAIVIRVPDIHTEVKKWLLNPEVDIPPETTAVHGITTEYAREFGQSAAEGLEEIAAELASHLVDGAPVVVFNASFDLPLLDADLRRHGLPTMAERVGHNSYPVLDPLVLDRWVDQYRKGKRKLGDLVNHYQVKVSEDLHDAAVDTVATLDVLEKMSRIWPQIGTTELEQFRAIQSNAHRRWATGFNDWLRRQGSTREGPSLVWL
ncbi:MAG: exonuclease domain-containing protein [Promicromonosporaceae bacterium]|nr:exonuclease domain-containing protein [Promicromonosporaceae bacterium]